MSKVDVNPGATVNYQAVNHFREPEFADFPVIGRVLLVPSGGASVIARDGIVALVTFIPEDADSDQKIALVSGMSAEEAHRFGSNLIAAAAMIGGDRGLQ